MTEELKPCRFCEGTPAATPTEGLSGLMQCAKCGYTTTVWNEANSIPRLSDLDRKWLELAPDFSNDGHTEILFNERANKGDHYWDTCNQSWENAAVDRIYRVICRPNQPEWKVGQLWKSESGRWLRKIVHVNTNYLTIEIVKALCGGNVDGYIGEVTTYRRDEDNPLRTSSIAKEASE